MANKKQIFHKPTPEQITKGREAVEYYFNIDTDSPTSEIITARNELVDILQNIDPEKQYLEIKGDLIPDDFFYTRKDKTDSRLSRTVANRKFMKHGPEVMFPRYRSVDAAVKAMRDQRKVPVYVREEKFDGLKPGFYCAYSFVPIIPGNDKRKRKVPLIEVVDGSKLFAYALRQGTGIEITPYSDSERVETDGGTVKVKIPSRTPKRGSYEFIISAIPIVDNDKKYAIANSIVSNHDCADMLHKIRYKYAYEKENSRVFNWDVHDIAGFYAAIQHYLEEEHNMIPLAMSQIPIPSQEFIRLHDMLRYNTVISTKEHEEQEQEKLYSLNNAEREISLQFIAQALGHNETLFAKGTRDGNFKDYDYRELSRTA
ncbi:hypothetical protein ACFL0W_00405 [Nanoarchaeota archaeon]